MKEQDLEIVTQATFDSQLKSNPLLPQSSNPFRILSLILLLFLFYSIIHFFILLPSSQHFIKPQSQLTYTDYVDMLELESYATFQSVILKYRIHEVVLSAYFESNIVLALVMLVGFFFVVVFVEKESATSVLLYEFHGQHIYIQIWRIITDGIQYFMTGKCICLSTGMAAVYFQMMLKIFYYNFKSISKSSAKLILFSTSIFIFVSMIYFKNRLDILVSGLITLVEIVFFSGGTIKYPKDVYYQKQLNAERSCGKVLGGISIGIVLFMWLITGNFIPTGGRD